MNATVKELETRPEKLWREYVEASRKAQRTLNMQDGIEASRAWQRWIEEYARQS